MLNSFYKTYQAYTFTETTNEYHETIKTKTPFKTITAALSLASHSQYSFNNIELQQADYVAITRDTGLTRGMLIDMYIITYIIPYRDEFVVYLKAID